MRNVGAALSGPRSAAWLLAVLLGACPAMLLAQGTLERIKSENVVRVGVAAEPPYGYIDEQGRVTGEAPEIARRILARIDPEIRLEGVSMNFGELIPSLRDEEIDIITAGMFITPERCRQIAFSDPTYVVGEAFAVRRGNPKDLTDYASISDNPDARVGLISGTVEYNYAVVAGIPAERALLYTSFRKALRALQQGEIDAVGLTSLTVRSLLRELGDPSLESTAQFYPVMDGEVVKGYGAFGFRKQDQALRDTFNERLDDFVGTEEHWAAVEPFGFQPDMKPDKTAEELCAARGG